MKINKVSEEILDKIKELQQKSNKVVRELGEIEVNKIILNNRKKAVEEFLREINVEQDAVLKEIKEKYGEINIDLSTGEYSSISE